jgi:hypothetical protein
MPLDTAVLALEKLQAKCQRGRRSCEFRFELKNRTA